MLFVSVNVTQFPVLLQDQPARTSLVFGMVAQLDKNDSGTRTKTSVCEAVRAAEVSVSNIARLNRTFCRIFITTR